MMQSTATTGRRTIDLINNFVRRGLRLLNAVVWQAGAQWEVLSCGYKSWLMDSQNPLHLNVFPRSANRVTAGVEWGLGAGGRLIKGLQRPQCAALLRHEITCGVFLTHVCSFIFTHQHSFTHSLVKYSVGGYRLRDNITRVLCWQQLIEQARCSSSGFVELSSLQFANRTSQNSEARFNSQESDSHQPTITTIARLI